MTITARYPGRCSRCSQPIEVGQRINWSQGRQATHEQCGETTPPAAQQQRSRFLTARQVYGREAARRQGGTCREPGCHRPAVRGGYCASCAFDELD